MPFTDSDPATTDLSLRGVWLHDPDDPEATLRNYPYGNAARSDSYDAMQAGTYYVGKEDPVFDFGDSSAFAVDVTIVVPHGSDYTNNMVELRWFAAQKKNLWFRDNRSRAIYGTMSNFKTSDTDFGSTVSFTFTKANRYVEKVVVA